MLPGYVEAFLDRCYRNLAVFGLAVRALTLVGFLPPSDYYYVRSESMFYEGFRSQPINDAYANICIHTC